jgi:hypothetical protein
LVITDGEPDDKRAVIEVIVQATKQMERDHAPIEIWLNIHCKDSGENS